MNAQQASGHVVVGADGSEQGYAGVQYAAVEAARRGVPLDVVHVIPGYVPVGPFLMIPEGSLQEFGTSVADRAALVAAGQEPGLRVAKHVLSGNRVRELIHFSEGACLLVLSARHLSVMEHLTTGSTVTAVVSRARCPVAVLPVGWQAPPTPHRRVVAGYKSSSHSAELFEDAFAVAEALDAELVVLHAWKLEGVYDDVVAGHVEEERWNTEERAMIETLLEDYRESYPDVPVRVVVVHDRPTHALVHASRTADRLVLVKPAHGARLHHLGATARAVLRMSSCPVELLATTERPEMVAGLTVEANGHMVR
ncbi:universal stress protein [Nocardioides cynanchi]|uniref:universal stress protein n=1 Tax=Nocardioides cynanchi TaxID=2558918 RepID=UPI0012457B0B|nr:universal stress protein [Nocardioides cynanchi]